MTSTMLLKILFWLFVAIDLAGIGLWFVLGLAAAGPSRTSPLAVTLALLILPGLLLAGTVFLFVRTESAGWRLAALLLVSAPALALGISHIAAGSLAQAPNAGVWGSTPLTRALAGLQQDPTQLAVVRQLLADGADPNQTGEELPLVLAIRAVRHAGMEPLRLLLDAGAQPNARSSFGGPAYFAALGITVGADVLQLLLERGADPRAVGRDGRSGTWYAVAARNWPAALVLVQRGAGWAGRSPMGRSFLDTLEGEAQQLGEAGPLGELLALVRKAERGK